MKEVYQPLLKLGAFTCLLAVLVGVEDLSGINLLHSYKWFFLVFFAVQTVLTTVFIHVGIGFDKNKMALFYFLAMTFRFVLSLSAAFIMVYKGIDEKVQFVVNFFALYLLFIMFEIYPILTNLRPNLSSSEK